MPLNIKNREIHEQAQELASLKGVSISKAVGDAIREALEHERVRRSRSFERRRSALDEVAADFARLPVVDSRSAEEILGYDEQGVPSS